MSPLATNPASRPHASSPRAGSWADRAACINRLAEFESGDDAAKAICAGCPVTAECLSSALAEEGQLERSYREGVRGGLTAGERTELSRPKKEAPVGVLVGDAVLAETMLRSGEHSVREVAAAAGMCSSSVDRLRHSLGLDGSRPSRSPLERFTARVVPGEDGHVLWTGGPSVGLGGRREISGLRLAFRLGYERDPEGMVKSVCGTPRCVAWQHLADRSLRAAHPRPPRRRARVPEPVGEDEFLYGIHPGHWEATRWVRARVVAFRVVRKTPLRIFYVRRDDPDAPQIGSVDRRRIEADGDILRAGSRTWEPDHRLYLARPDLTTHLTEQQKPGGEQTDAAWLDAAAAA
ncbi:MULTISPECIES: WhiB family transcriptional regulator [unclassified Streptomyces]|uniref:WhiB family transcriptional regulator n=1 Tax=unclassified Streptomyces TaxID=2593676 RepID=UPI003649DF54